MFTNNTKYIYEYNRSYLEIMSIMRRDLFSLEPPSSQKFKEKNQENILRLELHDLMNKFYEDGFENPSLFKLFEKIILPIENSSINYKDEELSHLILDCYLVLFNFVNDRNFYLESVKRHYEHFQSFRIKFIVVLKFLKEEI